MATFDMLYLVLFFSFHRAPQDLARTPSTPLQEKIVASKGNIIPSSAIAWPNPELLGPRFPICPPKSYKDQRNFSYCNGVTINMYRLGL